MVYAYRAHIHEGVKTLHTHNKFICACSYIFTLLFMQFILLHDYNYIENLIDRLNHVTWPPLKWHDHFSHYIASFINQNNDVSIPFSLCIRTELNSLASY